MEYLTASCISRPVSEPGGLTQRSMSGVIQDPGDGSEECLAKCGIAGSASDPTEELGEEDPAGR